jgi:hypothetical protein
MAQASLTTTTSSLRMALVRGTLPHRLLSAVLPLTQAEWVLRTHHDRRPAHTEPQVPTARIAPAHARDECTWRSRATWHSVFAFSEGPCKGLDEVLYRYREIVPAIQLSGSPPRSWWARMVVHRPT